MKTVKMLLATALFSLLISPVFAGGGDGEKNESQFNFNQLKKEVEAIVKPLALKAKAANKMWVVFKVDENRQLQLLDHSAELNELSDELKNAINNRLLKAGSFYSDTPYTLWVKVTEI